MFCLGSGSFGDEPSQRRQNGLWCEMGLHAILFHDLSIPSVKRFSASCPGSSLLLS